MPLHVRSGRIHFETDAVGFICSQLSTKDTRTNAFHLISDACCRTCVVGYVNSQEDNVHAASDCLNILLAGGWGAT